MTTEIRSQLVIVIGRVQGVGFREACVVEARRLGVTGWVRNRSDGTVQALLQGSPPRLEAMHEWLRRGPPAARVDAVRLQDPPADTPTFARFERLPTG